MKSDSTIIQNWDFTIHHPNFNHSTIQPFNHPISPFISPPKLGVSPSRFKSNEIHGGLSDLKFFFIRSCPNWVRTSSHFHGINGIFRCSWKFSWQVADFGVPMKLSFSQAFPWEVSMGQISMPLLVDVYPGPEGDS